jgi:AbrB family looped-hinge helix DNA binding protein
MNTLGSFTLRISKGGRIVIPAEYRHALGLREGDEVILSLVDGELRLTTRQRELRRAQAIVARYGKDDASWSEELLAERRTEAAHE